MHRDDDPPQARSSLKRQNFATTTSRRHVRTWAPSCRQDQLWFSVVDAKTEELRAAHDVLAEFYADRLANALARMPAERAVLEVFCDLTIAADLGTSVADVGCGTRRLEPYVNCLSRTPPWQGRSAGTPSRPVTTRSDGGPQRQPWCRIRRLLAVSRRDGAPDDRRRLRDRVLGWAPRRGAGGLPAGVPARSEVLKPVRPALTSALNSAGD